MNIPGEFPARIDRVRNVWLDCLHRPDRPNREALDRLVADNVVADAGLLVFHAEVVVFGGVAEATWIRRSPVCVHQSLEINKFVILLFDQTSRGRASRHDLKWKRDRQIFIRTAAIRRKHIVVVHRADDRLDAGVFEAVFDYHFRLTGHEANNLAINIAVAIGGVVDFLGKLHGILILFDRPLAGIDNVINAGVIVAVRSAAGTSTTGWRSRRRQRVFAGDSNGCGSTTASRGRRDGRLTLFGLAKHADPDLYKSAAEGSIREIERATR